MADESFEALCEALTDQEPRIRWEAAHALGRLAHPESVDTLITALDDPAPKVVKHVVQALRKLGDGRAIEPLRSIILRISTIPDDRPRWSSQPRKAAYRSYARMQGGGTHHDFQRDIVTEAVLALWEMNAPDLGPVLLVAADAVGWHASIILALGDAGDEAAIDYLIGLRRADPIITHALMKLGTRYPQQQVRIATEPLKTRPRDYNPLPEAMIIKHFGWFPQLNAEEIHARLINYWLFDAGVEDLKQWLAAHGKNVNIGMAQSVVEALLARGHLPLTEAFIAHKRLGQVEALTQKAVNAGLDVGAVLEGFEHSLLTAVAEKEPQRIYHELSLLRLIDSPAAREAVQTWQQSTFEQLLPAAGERPTRISSLWELVIRDADHLQDAIEARLIPWAREMIDESPHHLNYAAKYIFPVIWAPFFEQATTRAPEFMRADVYKGLANDPRILALTLLYLDPEVTKPVHTFELFRKRKLGPILIAQGAIHGRRAVLDAIWPYLHYHFHRWDQYGPKHAFIELMMGLLDPVLVERLVSWLEPVTWRIVGRGGEEQIVHAEPIANRRIALLEILRHLGLQFPETAPTILEAAAPLAADRSIAFRPVVLRGRLIADYPMLVGEMAQFVLNDLGA